MIRLQTESKPPPQPFIGVVYRGLCLFRGGNPQNPIMEDRFVKSRHMAENCSEMKFLAMLPPVCGFVLTDHWLHSRQY